MRRPVSPPLVLVGLFTLAAPWSIAVAQGAVVLGALWVVWAALRRQLPPFTVRWTHAAILLYLTLQAMSIPLGVDPGASLRAFRGSWVMLFPLVFWGLTIKDHARTRAIEILVLSGALAGLYGAVQFVTGREWFESTALEEVSGGGYLALGTLGHHLTYGGVLLPLWFVALGLAADRRRTIWFVAAGAIGAGVLFSFARTAWVGLAAGLLVLGWHRGRRTFWLTVGGLSVAAVLAVVLVPTIGQRAASLLEIADRPRMRLWLTSLRIAAAHPWTGGGVGCFGPLFPEFQVPGTYLSTAHPHNDLLNALVDTGIPGALAWLSIWVAFFIDSRPRTPLWMPQALRAAVASLLVAGLGQCYSTDEEVAQVWWFIVTVALAGVRAQASDLRRNSPSAGTAPGAAGPTPRAPSTRARAAPRGRSPRSPAPRPPHPGGRPPVARG